MDKGLSFQTRKLKYSKSLQLRYHRKNLTAQLRPGADFTPVTLAHHLQVLILNHVSVLLTDLPFSSGSDGRLYLS